MKLVVSFNTFNEIEIEADNEEQAMDLFRNGHWKLEDVNMKIDWNSVTNPIRKERKC